MTFDGALVKEQGVTFAVIAVKPYVTQTSLEANEAINSFSRFFPGVPVVLMSQNSSGRANYYGRRDIVNFLSRISVYQLPWKTYTYH